MSRSLPKLTAKQRDAFLVEPGMVSSTDVQLWRRFKQAGFDKQTMPRFNFWMQVRRSIFVLYQKWSTLEEKTVLRYLDDELERLGLMVGLERYKPRPRRTREEMRAARAPTRA